MANVSHTYDPSCLLHNDSNVFTRRASQISIGAPPTKAHYFYCSSLPIDDPLLPVPPPASGPGKSTKIPPRPFSVHDNRALEEAWLRIHKPYKSIESPKKPLVDTVWRESPTRDPESKIHDTVSKIFKGAQEKQSSRKSSLQAEDASQLSQSGSTTITESQGSPTRAVSRRGTASFDDVDPLLPAPRRHSRFEEQFEAQTNLPTDSERKPLSQVSPLTVEEIGDDEYKAGLHPQRRRSRSPFSRKEKDAAVPAVSNDSAPSQEPNANRRTSEVPQQSQPPSEYGSSPTERSTTGTPFLRIASRLGRSSSRSRSRTHDKEIEDASGLEQPVDGGADGRSPSPSRATLQRLPRSNHLRKDSPASKYATSRKVQEAKVPVGVSRLHVVELPVLKVSGYPCYSRQRAS